MFLRLVNAVSTPEQKCIGFPERKYINDAGKKAPDWRPSLQASGLGGIIRRPHSRHFYTSVPDFEFPQLGQLVICNAPMPKSKMRLKQFEIVTHLHFSCNRILRAAMQAVSAHSPGGSPTFAHRCPAVRLLVSVLQLLYEQTSRKRHRQGPQAAQKSPGLGSGTVVGMRQRRSDGVRTCFNRRGKVRPQIVK
jgi:hypothetical protein